jgi:hypothetical protein
MPPPDQSLPPQHCLCTQEGTGHSEILDSGLCIEPENHMALLDHTEN